MKQLLVLSGKGGTGKTTVSSAMIALSKSKSFADCDVDAPNLHLVTAQDIDPQKSDYFGFQKAYIDSEKCIKCGLCEKNCHFNSIHNFFVNISECEGCAVCSEICPVNAIEMKDFSSGEMLLYKNESKTFSTAKLKTGSGASGKLVTAVKKQLKDNSVDLEFAIIDGSPGIGCPVIASISGVDIVLIVAEPTVSGIHDMKRIIETANKFGTKCIVCINKYDVNERKSIEIDEYCNLIGIPVLGKIPYDKTVLIAVNCCKSIAEYPNSSAAKAIAELWDKIKIILY